MADYSGLDEATLNEKLKAASDYEERSAVRRALRQLKKEQGRPVGRPQREATYNRFAGTSATATKSVAPKSYIGKEGSSGKASPARGPTPTQTPPVQSPRPFSPQSWTPQGRTQSPLEPPSPSVPPVDEPDSIPPHTEEPEPPVSPEVSSPPPPPRSPSPTSPLPDKFQEEEVVDGADEGAGLEDVVEARVEGLQPDTSDDDKEGEVGELEEEDQEEEERQEEEEEDEEEEEEGEEEEKEEWRLADEEEAEEEREKREEEDDQGETAENEEEEEEEHEEEEEEKEPVKPPVQDPPSQAAETAAAEDDADGSPFGKKIQSRRPETTPTSGPQEKGGARAEFQGFKLRKTFSQEQRESNSPRGVGGGAGNFNFGVQLRSRPSPSTTDALPSKTAYTPPSPPRSRAKTFGSARQVAAAFSSSSSSPSGPRTLRDFQQLSARSQRSKVKSPDEEDEEGTTLPVDELQRYLVAYVNQELSLSPSIPSRGKALYDVCSDTTNLCKLINKSVRNTVDLRALTIITPSMPIAEREEAIEENMTLTIESARAIGCRVTDSTGDLIIKKDPPTIRSFLVDLIRARVVHLPGMEDEPQTTFTNLSVLFSKLGISEGVDGEGEGGAENGEVEDKGRIQWREDGERLRQALKTPPKSPPSNRSWRDMEKPSSPTERTATSSSVGDTNLTYEERAALRRTEREEERLGEDTSTLTLTYEERAAMRRAERERKRRERAELAGSQ